jgi:hypothetical protein
MSNQSDYAAKLEAAKNLNADDVQVPYIPVGIYAQEAEDLYHWCKDDLAQLTNAGLSEEVINNLPVCTGALREAQSIWMKEQQTRKEAEQKWVDESPVAFDFRDQLVHSFRYAFRKSSDLLNRVDAISEGASNADMVQDLNDLAILGKANTELLQQIGFDLQLLDKAAEQSDYLADLLGQANGDRKSENESKEIRDRMYTLLKYVVDEIRDCGKYVFWQNENRLKGYSSVYMRRYRGRSSSKASNITSDSTEEEGI